MVKYLIKDTTEEERRKIVNDSIGNIDGLCDGCSPGLIDMYDAYIKGEKEISEITMEFNARYVKGNNEDEKSSCIMNL